MEKDAFEMTDKEVLNVDILKETINSNNSVNKFNYFIASNVNCSNFSKNKTWKSSNF